MQDDETPEQDETLTDEEASAEDDAETDDGEAESTEEEGDTDNKDISVEEKSWNEYLDIYKGEIEVEKKHIDYATSEIERLEAFDNPEIMGDAIEQHKINIEIAEKIIEDKIKEIQSLETVDEDLRDIFYTELPPVDVETPIISMDANLSEEIYQSFSKDNWAALNNDQRLEIISETANALKNGLGDNKEIKMDVVINPNMASDANCVAQSIPPKIEINPNVIDDPEKIIEIIGHEVRHYQQINRNESTSLGDLKYDEIAYKNYQNQYDPNLDRTLYDKSFIERDARNFAEKFVQEFNKRLSSR
jgi:hypothetical protein